MATGRWCARRDLKELGFLVEHREDVAAEHGQFDAQVAEAGEQRADVVHGATAVELPVDARLKECLFGFEVVIKRARPWRQAGGGFDLGDAGGLIALFTEESHRLGDQSISGRR